MEPGGASRPGAGGWRRAGVVVCGMAVLAVFVGLATQAHELTSMYGGFLGWGTLLLLFGAVGGVIVVALAYTGARLAGVRRQRGRIVASMFVLALVMSLTGGFVGSLQHDPARQQRDAERAQAEDCRSEGGTYDSANGSCSFPGDQKPPIE